MYKTITGPSISTGQTRVQAAFIVHPEATSAQKSPQLMVFLFQLKQSKGIL